MRRVERCKIDTLSSKLKELEEQDQLKTGRDSRWRCENNPGLKLSLEARRG